ncbi:MAG: hypothetical protein DYG94_02800 [Leptolyngbya sp. PLA3]|nr:MAG: hypothetical protein EDM82_11500 [Cyanobacteria bacterium CYA]MCE7967657.1 hypothetical protein [Leptolyngbya sp. PL-A3]
MQIQLSLILFGRPQGSVIAARIGGLEVNEAGGHAGWLTGTLMSPSQHFPPVSTVNQQVALAANVTTADARTMIA